MILLYLFTFLAGLTTILSPCIWPILPIIFITASGGKKKPIGIAIGVSISFAILTLLVSYLLKIFSFDPIIFRYIAVAILLFLGISLIVPKIMAWFESGVSKLSSKFSHYTNSNSEGLWAGLVTGLALGVVWTPCAGPILATIATLASTQILNTTIFIMIGAFTLGLAIPLFLLALFGNKITNKTKSISKHTGQIQKVFGVIIVLISISIATNFDLILQSQIYKIFPQLSEVTRVIENNKIVEKELEEIHKTLNEEEQSVVCRADQGRCEATNKDLVSSGKPLEVGNKAPELTGLTEWLNTDKEYSLNDLNGKVVVLEFWSMDCVNCVDVIPHLKKYKAMYSDDGLVVLGIHTPEFKPEKNSNRLKNAIRRYKIDYPVGVDNDYKVWKTYKNKYWPTIYVIGKDGTIVYKHEGRDNYNQLQTQIEKALHQL